MNTRTKTGILRIRNYRFRSTSLLLSAGNAAMVVQIDRRRRSPGPVEGSSGRSRLTLKSPSHDFTRRPAN